MDRIKIFSLCVLAAFSAMSCSKDELTPSDPVRSKYLVLSVECDNTAKTTISAGKTSWEAGDEIAVVYDGDVYKYTTTESGAKATFTSTDGIKEYEASKGLSAYYPSTVVAGVFSIPEEPEVTTGTKTEHYTSKPQLTGIPSGVVTSGVLPIHFKNVSSVLELVMDACPDITERVTTMTIAPANPANITGSLTFVGPVEYETLALKPTKIGNLITISFKDGLDVTKAQDIKIPIGRFASPEGLSVSIQTQSGAIYNKQIYKTGVASAVESGGIISLKHISKALLPFQKDETVIEIGTLAQLQAFAAAVNSQDGTEKKTAILTADIDMASATSWTPIGNATAAAVNFDTSTLAGSGSYSGPAFKGIFNGMGHKITNFKTTSPSSGAYGLFGVLDGATVEGMDISGTMTAGGTSSQLFVGAVAGICYNSKIKNCKTAVNFTIKGMSTNKVTLGAGGVVGSIFSSEPSKASAVSGCVNSGGIVSAEKGGNTGTGIDAVCFGGISALATATSGAYNTISECSNSGDMGTKTTPQPLARCSGILANQTFTKLISCVNSGNQYNTGSSGRIGQISCYVYDSEIKDCINNGNLTTTQTSTTTAGISALVNGSTIKISGGGNTGVITSACTNTAEGETAVHRGLLFANLASFASVSDMRVAGSLYQYNSTAPTKIPVSSLNYMEYIGRYKSSDASKLTNIIWEGVDPKVGISTKDELKEFRDLVNAGSSYSKFVGTDGYVHLLDNISLSGEGTWTPIGNGFINDDGTTTGKLFTGKFSGDGFTISGFTGRASNMSDSAYGFFGAINGATITGLTLSGSLEVTAAGKASASALVGMAMNSTISEVTTKVSFKSDGSTATSARFVLGGIVGTIVNKGEGTSISNCNVNSDATLDRGSNTNNGLTSVMYGGIVGYALSATGATLSTTSHSTITNCVNNGKMTASSNGVSRCAGIIASCEAYVKLSSCTNNGTQTNAASNCRLGQIAASFGSNCSMNNCINNGDLIVTAAGSGTRMGGIVGAMSAGTIKGGSNNARVVSKDDSYRGLIFGYLAKATEVNGVAVSGLIGTYVSADNYVMETVTESNFDTWSDKTVSGNTYKYSYLGACNSERTGLVKNCTLSK